MIVIDLCITSHLAKNLCSAAFECRDTHVCRALSGREMSWLSAWRVSAGGLHLPHVANTAARQELCTPCQREPYAGQFDLNQLRVQCCIATAGYEIKVIGDQREKRSTTTSSTHDHHHGSSLHLQLHAAGGIYNVYLKPESPSMTLPPAAALLLARLNLSIMKAVMITTPPHAIMVV